MYIVCVLLENQLTGYGQIGCGRSKLPIVGESGRAILGWCGKKKKKKKGRLTG